MVGFWLVDRVSERHKLGLMSTRDLAESDSQEQGHMGYLKVVVISSGIGSH